MPVPLSSSRLRPPWRPGRRGVVALKAAEGATIEALPTRDPAAAMSLLLAYDVCDILVGGLERCCNRSIWAAGVVDRVRLYVAPVTLGPGGRSVDARRRNLDGGAWWRRIPIVGRRRLTGGRCSTG